MDARLWDLLEKDPFRTVSRCLRRETETAASSPLAPESAQIADLREFPSRSREFDRRRSRLSDDLRIWRTRLPPEFGRVPEAPQVLDAVDPEAGGGGGYARGMAWSEVRAIPEYVYIAAFVILALLSTWRLGRYLRLLPPRHSLARAIPEIRAGLYFACGIALGAGGAIVACEGLTAHCGDQALGETLRAWRTGFAILAVLGGCALWAVVEAGWGAQTPRGLEAGVGKRRS